MGPPMKASFESDRIVKKSKEVNFDNFTSQKSKTCVEPYL